MWVSPKESDIIGLGFSLGIFLSFPGGSNHHQSHLFRGLL